MPNDFCHIELNTDDTGKARAFYSGLFPTWRMEEEKDVHGYTMIRPDAGPSGGIMKKPMPEAPNMWLVYVQVDDVAARADKAAKLGGKIIVPKTPIPGMGFFSIVADPTGAAFGIWGQK